jgi:Na+-driven multidrug efflux pump
VNQPTGTPKKAPADYGPPRDSAWTVIRISLLIYGGSLVLMTGAGLIWALFFEHTGPHTHDNTNRRLVTDVIIVVIAIVAFLALGAFCDHAFGGASRGWPLFLLVFLAGIALAYGLGQPHQPRDHKPVGAGGIIMLAYFYWIIFGRRRNHR